MEHSDTGPRKKIVIEAPPVSPGASEAETEILERSPRPSPSIKDEEEESHKASDSEDLPDADQAEEPGDSSSGEEGDSSDSDDLTTGGTMSDLQFHGKPNTLDDILTHCLSVTLSQPKKYKSETAKSGLLASKFRDKALTWLTKNLKENPEILENYEEFKTKLRKDFEASDDTRKLSADKRLKTISQKGSAQAFAIEFDTLTDILGWSDQAKRDGFKTRLKPEVRKQLIGDSSESYEDLRATAIEYDEELFALRNPRQRRAKGKGRGTTAPNKGASGN